MEVENRLVITQGLGTGVNSKGTQGLLLGGGKCSQVDENH